MGNKQGILEWLHQGEVLGDGGYLLELEERGFVQAGPYTPEVSIEHPEALRELHEEFKRSGSQVLQTLTFYGNREKLALVERAKQVLEINKSAVRVAQEVASNQLLVAGTITQTLSFLPGDSKACRQTRKTLEEQVQLLVEEGVDFLIGETFVYLEEALLALNIMKQSGLPVMVTMAIGPKGSKDLFSPAECARRLTAHGANIVGINCNYDPRVALETALEMKRATEAYVACQPIGYHTEKADIPFVLLPEFPLALERLQLTRFEMADFALQAKAMGIRYIGGCCGVKPYHVRAMAEALGRHPDASKKSPDLLRHVFEHIRQKDSAYWSKP